MATIFYVKNGNHKSEQVPVEQWEQAYNQKVQEKDVQEVFVTVNGFVRKASWDKH